MSRKYIDYFKKNYKIVILVFLISFFVFSKVAYCKEEYKEEITYDVKTVPVLEEKKELIEVIIFVDIKGNVVNPGVYQMKKGERIIDAIVKSGGVKEFSDTRNLNFAKLLLDEMIIYVPSEGETTCKVTDQNDVKEIENEVITEQTGKKISINTANQTELDLLPSIGPAKALEIIKYRETKGNFSKIEDIMNVPGIGEKMFEQIKNFITV